MTFLVFAYNSYYPLGGAHDVVDVCASRDDAVESARASEADYKHVVEVADGRADVVWDEYGESIWNSTTLSEAEDS